MISLILNIILILLIIVILVVTFVRRRTNKEHFSKMTDEWIKNVTEENNPNAVADMFCKDGILVGTVSQIIRKGDDIKKYFDFFAKLDGIEVQKRDYNIARVSAGVWVNNAFVTWKWNELDAPIVARMTFIFKDGCIFELHSSAMPEVNDALFEISGKK